MNCGKASSFSSRPFPRSLVVNTVLCFETPHAEGEEVLAADDGATRSGGVALRDVLAANYKRLHQRLQRFLGDPDLASDSLHDAWLRLGDRIPAQAVLNPEAYVYRVACNVAMDRLRSNRAWQYASDVDFELEGLPDSAPGPDSIAEVRSDIEAVERVMKQLPRRHRAVLVALRIDEMTRQEVASRYQLSLRGVDTALRQAMEHCAASLPRMGTATSRLGRAHSRSRP